MNTYAVARPVESLVQIALIGEAATRHECFDDAVQHVCAATGIAREQLWFRAEDAGLLVFEGWSTGRQQPVARLLDPVGYQAARSRGDLLDPSAFVHRATVRTHHSQARPEDSTPAGPTDQAAMTKTPTKPKAKPPKPGFSHPLAGKNEARSTKAAKAAAVERPAVASASADPKFLAYTVVKPLTWEGVEHAPGDRLVTRFYKPGSELLRLLADGMVREIKRGRPPKGPLATPETLPPVVAKAAKRLSRRGDGSEWTGMFAKGPGSIAVGKLAPDALAAGEAEEIAPDGGVYELLDPATIAPSPVNPRRHFDQDQMDELVASVRKTGVRQPISVRRVPEGAWVVRGSDDNRGSVRWTIDCLAAPLLAAKLPPELLRTGFGTEAEARAALPRYEIIAGERRWRAARLAGSATIRSIVEDMGDIEAGELQTIENIQRADLSPIEEASGYQHMLGLPGYNMARLVDGTGKSEATIRGKLKLLNLPETVQEAVEQGKLPAATAELIGRLKPELQAKAAEEIVTPVDRFLGGRRESLSFRAAKNVIDNLKMEDETARRRQAAVDQAKADGFHVLEGELARGALSYATQVAHNGGFVAAVDVCPRDPQGRTWGELVAWSNERNIEGIWQPAKTAVIGEDRVKGFVPVPVFARDQANRLLKDLGLWSAEGSAQAKALEEKRRAQETKARKGEEMLRDIDVIEAFAAKERSPRGPLLAAVWALTRTMTPGADRAARRRDWMDKEERMGAGRGIVRSMATDLEIGELQGLVTELALYAMGHEKTFFAGGRNELRRVFDLEFDGAGVEGAKPQTSAADEDEDEDEDAQEEVI